MSGTRKASIATQARHQVGRDSSRILAAVTGGHVVSHFLYQGFLVMLPAVRDALGIGPVRVGAIMTAREMASGLISLPAGVICDRLRRHWTTVLATCLIGFGLGWLVVALSTTYSILIAGMVLASMASSIWHLPAMAALSHRFSDRRGTALAIHGVGGAVGDAFGPLVTGILLAYLAWSRVLTAYSLVPIFLAGVAVWAFKDMDWMRGSEQADATAGTHMSQTADLLRNPALRRVNLVSGLRGMCYQAYTAFLPLFLADDLGLDSRGVGFHLGLLFSIGIVSSPAMGYLSDRWGRKGVLVPTLLALSLLSALLALLGEGIMLTVIIALLGVFVRSDHSLLSAAVLDIVGEGLAATTLGAMSLTRFAMGAISPLIAGVLYERMGMDAVLYYGGAIYALAAIVLLTTRLDPVEAG